MIDAPLADALSRYLDLSSQQMKATAGNMANIDTPGYHTQGFDFAGQFAQALQTTGERDAQVKGGDVAGLIARPDGNNVSIDRESVEMAKAQLQFRTGVDLLKHQFTSIMEAIKSA